MSVTEENSWEQEKSSSRSEVFGLLSKSRNAQIRKSNRVAKPAWRYEAPWQQKSKGKKRKKF